MSTSLGVTFFGKKIKPYAFAVSMTMFILVGMMIQNVAVGELLDGWHGDMVAVVAGASGVLLTVGWWFQVQRLLEWGLLLAAGAWMTVAAIIGFESGVWYHNTWLAFSWVVAGLGSWVLERENSE